jgi:biopolymer transport protein ExbD
VNFRRTRREETRVDVTPLIDIIFQLVLFFMVTTTFITAPGIQVDLPRSSAQTIFRDQQDLNIWVTDQGEVYVDQKAVSWEVLDATLDAAMAQDEDTLIIIKADANVDHGRVVTIMDLARTKGLSRLAIATDPGPAKQDD